MRREKVAADDISLRVYSGRLSRPAGNWTAPERSSHDRERHLRRLVYTATTTTTTYYLSRRGEKGK